MAPTRSYANPLEQLVELGREAKARGESFDEFWTRAVRPGVRPPIKPNSPHIPEGVVVWPSDREERKQWELAVAIARREWQAAYEDQPPERRALVWQALVAGVEAVEAKQHARV